MATPRIPFLEDAPVSLALPSRRRVGCDTYSRFVLLRPDPQELVAKLCIPGRGFELNAEGQPLKILRKNMTTLAQTWSILSFSNFMPTSHTSDITLERTKLIYGIVQKMDINLGYLVSHQISLTA